MKVVLTGYSVYYFKYHIVWVCKYRRRILKPGVEQTLRKLLPHLVRSMPGVVVETIGFDGDHLHMVMIIPPKYAISDVIGTLKNQSASYMRKKFTLLEKVYWKENIVWSPGYCVSSVGINEQVIHNYVKN